MQEEKYNFQNFPQKLSLASYNNSEFAFPNLNFTPKNNKTAKKSSASSESKKRLRSTIISTCSSIIDLVLNII